MVPTWGGFLAKQGGRGDRAAMKTLERWVDALIRTEKPGREPGRELGLVSLVTPDGATLIDDHLTLH